MERSKFTIVILLLSFLIHLPAIVTAEPDFIPWPVGTTSSGQDSSRTLFSSYGTHHIGWDQVPDPSGINFHFGIDIDANTSSTDGCDVVRNVIEGYSCDWCTDTLPTGEVQWTIVVGEEHLGPEGWCYQHLDELNIDFLNPTILHPIGDEIGIMHPAISHPHLHFMRSEAPYLSTQPALCNPLDFLVPAATTAGGFTWGWHESRDRSFFLPDMNYLDWGNWISVAEMWQDTLDREGLSGAVDFLFGQSHYGDGMASIPNAGIDADGIDELNPRRILWEVVRETPDGDETIDTRYVVDFRGELGGTQHDEEYKQFYFRYHYRELYTTEYGTLNCLSNSGDALPDPGWEGFGVSNIEENCWQTDIDHLFSEVTVNPVLAAFPDGPYRIDVTSYAYDTTETNSDLLDIKLHNFDPVVQEVIITGNTDEVVWHAKWVANDLVPELMILTNNSVAPDQTLDATVIFTEPMNTSSGTYSITAGKAPGYNDLIVTTTGWSCTNNPEPYYDTWSGTIEVPAEGYSGWISLKVEAEDTDGNCLKDPAGAFGDDEYSDLYHGFGIAFGPEEGWPVTLHSYVNGSPAIGDVDGEGNIVIAIQCEDGWVELLHGDGTSFSGWPMPFGWLPSQPNVSASVALADIDNNGVLDILAMQPNGCKARDISGDDLPGWPVIAGNVGNPGWYFSMSSPSVGDVDGDGNLEVIICRHLSGSTGLKPTVYLFEHTGGTFTWCRNLEPGIGGSSVISTPAIGDVSSSHSGAEILVCTAEGYQMGDKPEEGKTYNSAVYLLDPDDGTNIWKTSFSTWFYAAPVVADIDGDGTNEVIVGSAGSTASNRVFVLDGNTGTLEHTWLVGGWVMGPVGIGDLDGDGNLDVAVSVNGGKVHCWSGTDYQSLPGFPVTVSGNPSRGPSIADVDSDFELEIVVGTYDGLLYAINSDGSICTGYPVDCANGILGQVAIGELDGDGHLELVFTDTNEATAYCYDMGTGSFPAFTPWRQFQHDSWHSGFYEVDNTIPAPPTNLTGEITYPLDGSFIVDLEWELSVNDPLSSNPQDPADVVFYCIYIQFPPYTPFWVVGRTHAGDNTFTHKFTAGYPIVRYVVTAHDGTNESVQSNDIRFHTSGKDNLALGCSVYEEFSGQADIPGGIIVQAYEQRTEPEITQETSPTISLEASGGRIPVTASPEAGNPGCLTDGDISAAYTPSQGALYVVIDLGEVCSVSFVDLVNSSPVVAETTAPVIEYSTEGARYTGLSLMDEGSYSTRYIRITGAENASEVMVYGERETDSTPEQMTVSSHENVWSFIIPDVAGNPEGELRIYDVSGRLVWNERVDVSEELFWNGFRNEGTVVPSGLYLVHLTVGSDVFTSGLVVNR